MPGQPTLIKLTGATDRRFRVALAELTKTGDDAGDDRGAYSDPDHANAEPGGEIAARTLTEYHQPPDASTPAAEKPALSDRQDDTPQRPLARPTAVSLATGGDDTANPSQAVEAPVGATLVSWVGLVLASVCR